MRFLALDVGKRRTGLAFLDEETGIPLPLETFHHSSSAQLIAHVESVKGERNIDVVVLGLPLLPSGTEGEQAAFVREFGDRLIEKGIEVRYVDERFTTTQSAFSHTGAKSMTKHIDADAGAACAILNMFLGY